MQFLLCFQSRTRVNLLCFRSRARVDYGSDSGGGGDGSDGGGGGDGSDGRGGDGDGALAAPPAAILLTWQAASGHANHGRSLSF